MSEIEEAIKILNWTQSEIIKELWMIKVSYIKRAGSEQYAQPLSKTVFMNPKTDKKILLVKLSSMIDTVLNQDGESFSHQTYEDGQRLYDAEISLDDETIIKKEDNNPEKWYDFLDSHFDDINDDLLLFGCREGWTDTGWNSVFFYTEWIRMVSSNSNPQSMIIAIELVDVN
jgi:hypothetical protein|tara:strand:- start:9473 stop:9988 length:516 start_codon:yes stop_codon:yes gene_type:complete